MYKPDLIDITVEEVYEKPVLIDITDRLVDITNMDDRVIIEVKRPKIIKKVKEIYIQVLRDIRNKIDRYIEKRI